MADNNTIHTNEISGYRLLLIYLGLFFMLIGVIVLIPLILISFYHEDLAHLFCFLIPGVISIVVGLVLLIIFEDRKKEKARLKRRQSMSFVFIIWLIAILICSIPYLIYDGGNSFNFTQAIFEVTSGFSTTGLTTVDTPENLPHIFLFYRAFICLIGGVGLVLILTSAINDRLGLSLYYAEGHNDSLLPNLVKSARVIFAIYLVYILLGVFALILFGMDPFDAVCHSMAAVSTGGLSTKSNSIAYYANYQYGLGIEITLIILMLFGATNFIVHMALFTGKLKKVINNFELKVFLIETVIFLPIVIGFIYANVSTNSFGDAVRIGVFQFVSAATGTGFSTISFAQSAVVKISVLMFVFVVVMLIGGSTNCASGGFKLYRIGILFKSIFWATRKMLSSKNTVRNNYIIKYNEYTAIDDNEINSVYLYGVLYLLLFIIGVFWFLFHGYDLTSSMFEFASALSNTGLSVGLTSATLATDLLWAEILGMLLGRLEIIIVIIFFSRIFDFKRRLPNV